MNAHGEGVEFGFVGSGGAEGDVQERIGPHIHVTGGEGGQKNTGQCLIPTIIYSPLVLVCV